MATSKAARGPRSRPSPTPSTSRTQPLLWGGIGVVAIAIIAGAWLLWPAGGTAIDPVVAKDPGLGTRVEADAAAASEPGLVTKVESLYNDIYVYKESSGNLVLMFGAKRLRYTESEVNPADELDLPVYYTQSMTAGLAYAETLTDAMIIGLGGGRTAWYHHKSVPEIRMKAVELDPAVARIADSYFGVRPEAGFELAVEDGRVYLSNDTGRYDIILVDAYRGRFVPFHLLTSEFYKLVADHLKPGGVAVQNVEPTTMLFDSAVETIRSAFDHIVFFEGQGNIIILAYNGPERDEEALRKVAAERQSKYGFRYDLGTILDRRFRPTWKEDTEPLTDDFAPVEYLKAIARHNEKKP